MTQNDRIMERFYQALSERPDPRRPYSTTETVGDAVLETAIGDAKQALSQLLQAAPFFPPLVQEAIREAVESIVEAGLFDFRGRGEESSLSLLTDGAQRDLEKGS